MDLGQPSGYGPPKIAVLWYNLVSSELAYDYGGRQHLLDREIR
ncbi:hypothetical protein BFJ70_g5129 [Fusarium oxysporum]|nr:hypothetical protein BFJ67_g422 [Fusarium oxysporum f. sp. cepae]RKL05079.1 hypothetical protein BFJ71_g3318 [Fusarium oxysporum]RKL15718.1 hypothetical protein BFJ68_g5485 [Fusarium oxysporum]RKL40700.1 hypothetical protein BFJ70_g5129 [Fusarium oxysporum]